jgi:hypothetical protein
MEMGEPTWGGPMRGRLLVGLWARAFLVCRGMVVSQANRDQCSRDRCDNSNTKQQPHFELILPGDSLLPASRCC